MDKLISDFIEKQRVASVSCLDHEQNPYCFNIFYVFDKTERLLYFKSSSASKHTDYLHHQKKVAGTITPDRLNMLAIRGIQFTGWMDEPHPSHHHAIAEYYKKFSFAVAIPGEIWILHLESIKFTDNTISFGKKISWHREDLYEDIC